MLRILGRTSSINVRKVLWTCHEIGIDYQREDWGRGFQPTSSPEFLALNPHGLIPVVVDGDTVLSESNTICRYLAAKHGRHDLLPQNPAARAQVERWMDWQAADLNPAWIYAFHALSRNSPDHQDPASIAASVAAWKKQMAVLESQLGDGWIWGDAFTLADISLGLSVQRWLLTPFDKPRLPAVEAYYQRLRQRPAYLTHGSDGVA
ncbi:glutathione S-transferase [Chromobacterium subtsugae]|uniref:Glutathione S-transferase n=1 Tax=Chromobacterium subtsugae TaxID=251747 RepID=A0ABS7F7W0_9NEIS|nr:MULTISPECIES: glutathione S-transferase [Chromobacterium]KUM02201.1 glutathione S-transferase [Chromobacterium subtsugae]KZE83146.1 glutathione S-transferase [Chromobacterium sp. F49]MBW7567106.1 glutathione S-transferase [Chromobacterium subtsugae]MBW8286076.1 glutathione S-transferase [Chromobacterium subtsugae]OBU86337.1 glutathione S-transferase [Chromobacterium subtsugae]